MREVLEIRKEGGIGGPTRNPTNKTARIILYYIVRSVQSVQDDRPFIALRFLLALP